MNQPIHYSSLSIPGRFTIRVYGILLDTHQRILVSDEYIRGNYFTKFPGGGLELGEGTRDCLKREFKEETGLEVNIGNHIYTTDYYQVSAFNTKDQIISIYYYAQAQNENDLSNLRAKTKPFDFTPQQIADPSPAPLHPVSFFGQLHAPHIFQFFSPQ